MAKTNDPKTNDPTKRTRKPKIATAAGVLAKLGEELQRLGATERALLLRLLPVYLEQTAASSIAQTSE